MERELEEEYRKREEQIKLNRKLRSSRHRRFVVEVVLVLLLGVGVWSAVSFEMFWVFPQELLLLRLGLFAGVAVTFFAVVYYGTSFEVTPLQLLLPWVMKPKDNPYAPQVTVIESAIRRSELSTVQDPATEYELAEAAQPALVRSIRPAKYETVNSILQSSSVAAAKLADKMERRINTHLILGVLVGFAGLFVWYYSFFIVALPSAPNQEWWVHLVPRITILLFIELLAGFFLRQYRIGVEDLKYFLELQRRANANRIAYSIFNTLDDRDAMGRFASALLEAKSDTTLQTGQTTTVLEAMKLEENIALKTLTILGEQLESLTKLVKKDKT